MGRRHEVTGGRCLRRGMLLPLYSGVDSIHPIKQGDTMPSNSLEQEAMDRVRRMYASFDRPAPRPQAVRKPDPAPVDRSESSEPIEPTPPRDSVPRMAENKPNSLLDIFLKDQDQSLILLLLVMLMKDGADMNLMLALVYLLI